MTTYAQIHKTIVERIKSKFTGIKVLSTDADEKIIRPSFQISFDEVKAIDFMGCAIDRSLTVRLYFFATTEKNNKIELLETQGKLEELFLQDNIMEVVDGFKAEIQELDFDVIDKVLHCSFEIMTSETYEKIDTTETMETLHVGETMGELNLKG